MKQGASRSKRTPQTAGDCTPWCQLTQRKKDNFIKSFLTNEARFSRESALNTRKRTYDNQLVTILSLYQKFIKLRRKSPILSDEEIEVRGLLSDWFLTQVFSGKWDALRSFADYGERHCKAGLLFEESSLPGYDDIFTNADFSGDTLDVVILREFAQISGIRIRQLIEPIALVHSAPAYQEGIADFLLRMQHSSPPVIPEYLEKVVLPTKAFLKERSLKRWSKLTGAKPQQPDSMYARTLRKLGLSGLPTAQGKAKRLDPNSLNKIGGDLRDYLKR